MVGNITPMRMIAYGVIVVLLVVIVLALGGSSYLARTSVVPPKTEFEIVRVGEMTAQKANEKINVDILTHPRYLGIDRTLLHSGRLPVTPPEPRGKQNLFVL